MRDAKLGSLVVVEWLDSAESCEERSGWLRGKQTYAPKRIRTIGEVIDSSPVALTVAGTISADGPEDGVLSPLTIPRGCIVRVRKL